MMFTAINIGPIVSTLSLARKPRELWSASYLFSYLMKCIYEEVEEIGGEECIISPAKVGIPTREDYLSLSSNAMAVGLYPDRIYIKAEIDFDTIIDKVKDRLEKEHSGIPFDYFNIMKVTCDAGSEPEAIMELNRQMDILELFNIAPEADLEVKIVNLLKAKTEKDKPGRARSKLFELATGQEEFEVMTLRQIARAGREAEEKSFDRYVCIVQADGDNVGKTISNPSLQEGKVKRISDALLEFGKEAARMIDQYGGMPLYAGGDDLLFIAPVRGKGEENIFDLVQKLDSEAFASVKSLIPDASLSFGVACHFVKFPLYESLAKARELLYEAKHWEETKETEGKTLPGPKNTVSWTLQKHSGGSFHFTFSMKDSEVIRLFNTLIKETEKSEIISAVAHKIRQYEALLKTLMVNSEDSSRLDAFFKRTLEFQDTLWFKTVKELIPALYASVGEEQFISSLFGLLRTAKFIHGEDVHEDEFIED